MDPNVPCVFPFKKGDGLQEQCALDPTTGRLWCPTKVRISDRQYEGGLGKWGFCSNSCQSLKNASKTITQKDFKVSATFSKSATAWRDCGKTKDQRLADTKQTKGKNTTIDLYPWMVSIQDSDGNLHCGGSIVASNRIITAAHCFHGMSKDEIRSHTVVAGSDNPFEFHSQLWRFTIDGFLINKLRHWQYDDKLSEILDDGSIEIKIRNQDKLLTWNETSRKINFEDKVIPMKANQTWTFIENLDTNWGKIQHLKSGKYLTTRYINSYTILTVEEEVVEEEGKLRLEIDEVVIHPDYAQQAYQDVAVIKLKAIDNQLWSYNKTSKKLYNKKFGAADGEWSIPVQEAGGILENKSSGKVLSLKQKTNCGFGSYPLLQNRVGIKTWKGCEDASIAMIWTRSENINDEYFTLKSKVNGQLLTQIKMSGKKKYRIAGEGIPFDKTKQPICLPTDSNENPEKWNGESVDIVGFAVKDFAGTKGERMKVATMEVYTQALLQCKIRR